MTFVFLLSIGSAIAGVNITPIRNENTAERISPEKREDIPTSKKSTPMTYRTVLFNIAFFFCLYSTMLPHVEDPSHIYKSCYSFLFG